MMLAEDIKGFLNGIMSVIKLNELPDTPDDVLGIFNTGGYNPTRSFTGKFEQPTFQVRVRCANPRTALEIIEAVKERLDGISDIVSNSTRYISIFQQGDVFPLGKDARGRTEMTINFEVKSEGVIL